MARHDDTGGGTVFTAFLLGALAGAALALMYAPAPGDETRRRLADRAREGCEQANKALERGRAAFEKARREAARSAEDDL